MSTATSGLAEVYVMKKLYKEKLKRVENAARAGGESHDSKRSSNSGGGFFKMFKKAVHPGAVPSSDSSTETWNNIGK